MALLLSRAPVALAQGVPELLTDTAQLDPNWHVGVSPSARTLHVSHARRADSIRAQLAAHPQPDSARAVLLSHLADELATTDMRGSGQPRRAAYEVARRVGKPDLLDELALDLADYHIALAQYDSARLLLAEAQRLFIRQHDLGGQMRCLGRYARIADQQGQLAEALGYCLRGMAMSSSGDQRRFHTSLKIHAASLYTRLGEYASADAYLHEALAVARKNQYPDRINLIMTELGELARRQAQWNKARHYYSLSIAVSRQIGVVDEATIRSVRFHLADVTDRLGQHAAALAQGRAALHEAT
ncbi:tetratricopeptide repeat protein, partial [Hymenobacter agri]